MVSFVWFESFFAVERKVFIFTFISTKKATVNYFNCMGGTHSIGCNSASQHI